MCVTNRASCFARAMEMQRISHPDRKDEGKLPISWDAQEPIPHRAPSLPRRHCRQADKVRSHCRSIPALRQAGGGVIEQGWRASVSDSSRLLLQSSIVASLLCGARENGYGCKTPSMVCRVLEAIRGCIQQSEDPGKLRCNLPEESAEPKGFHPQA